MRSVHDWKPLGIRAENCRGPLAWMEYMMMALRSEGQSLREVRRHCQVQWTQARDWTRTSSGRREKADSRHWDWSNRECSGLPKAHRPPGGWCHLPSWGRKLGRQVMFEELWNIQLAVSQRTPTPSMKLETNCRSEGWGKIRLAEWARLKPCEWHT